MADAQAVSRTPQEVWDFHRQDSEQDMYPYSQFMRHRARGIILEIGVRGGASTSAFLLGIEQHGGYLYSVDLNADCACLFDHPRWTFVHANSQEIEKVLDAIHMLNAPFLDILFIDGDHTHPGIDIDLYSYSRLVKRGGMILMHDICPPDNVTPRMLSEGWGTEDVRDVYHEFLRERKYTHFELPGKFGMGVIYV